MYTQAVKIFGDEWKIGIDRSIVNPYKNIEDVNRESELCDFLKMRMWVKRQSVKNTVICDMIDIDMGL